MPVPLHRIATVIALGHGLLLAGCGKSPVAAPSPPAASSSPAPRNHEAVATWSGKRSPTIQIDASLADEPPLELEEFDPLKLDMLETPASELSEIAVVGFAANEKSRVLLKTMDETHAYAVGENVLGFEVTGIEPPRVSLTQDSVAYQIDLSNKHQTGQMGSLPFPGNAADPAGEGLGIGGQPPLPEAHMEQLGSPQLLIPEEETEHFIDPEDLRFTPQGTADN